MRVQRTVKRWLEWVSEWEREPITNFYFKFNGYETMEMRIVGFYLYFPPLLDVPHLFTIFNDENELLALA